MTHSSEFDDRHRLGTSRGTGDGTGTAARLRIGGWVPPSVERASLPSTAYQAFPAAGGWTTTGPGSPSAAQPASAPSRRAYGSDGPQLALVLTSVVVGLVATLVITLLPLFNAYQPYQPGPIAQEPIRVGLPTDSATPTPTLSPAAGSLSNRASAPARASASSRPSTGRPRTTGPTPRATASRPAPTTTAPRPQPTQAGTAELQALPPYAESGLRSTSGGRSTYVDFVNARRERVVVYWLDWDGRRRQYRTLGPGESYRQQTYVGHPWVVANDRGWALACFQPEAETRRAVVR
ncbi:MULTISPECIES: hypothetical protein [unclassified Micromonospora]|uniref:VHL beta domain-containing protein n=1 Tax=unclassified Micromonospora TaxID=2617518 RepID=UPI00363EC3D1